MKIPSAPLGLFNVHELTVGRDEFNSTSGLRLLLKSNLLTEFKTNFYMRVRSNCRKR
jgi:hypothetical protein